ncbi:MAG: hypothetical protein ACTS42_00040 [Candidatus Hodgkinia cicadicola]
MVKFIRSSDQLTFNFTFDRLIFLLIKAHIVMCTRSLNELPRKLTVTFS